MDSLCQPVYEVWLAEAVARGRISAPGFFVDPAQSQIDPSKEVKAAIEAVHEGFKTHEQATVELDGGDWEENMDQLEREKIRLGEVRGTTNMPASSQGNSDPDVAKVSQEGDDK